MGFNPCFRGSRPRTPHPPDEERRRSEFQSLFSWKSPSDSGRIMISLQIKQSFNPCFRGSRPRTSGVVCYSRGQREFQSLFSWKSPSDGMPETEDEWRKSSFNPCFRGSRPRTLVVEVAGLISDGFNPCFRGSRPRTLLRLKSCIRTHLGFNPCFRGSRPRTTQLQADRHQEGVSILVFVEVALGRQSDHQRRKGTEFQSLFSWKSPSDSTGKLTSSWKGKFQSLFSWKSPSDSILSHLPGSGRGVSILVFVEVALGLCIISRRITLIGRFNPCFRGSRPRTVPSS